MKDQINVLHHFYKYIIFIYLNLIIMFKTYKLTKLLKCEVSNLKLRTGNLRNNYY